MLADKSKIRNNQQIYEKGIGKCLDDESVFNAYKLNYERDQFVSLNNLPKARLKSSQDPRKRNNYSSNSIHTERNMPMIKTKYDSDILSV